MNAKIPEALYMKTFTIVWDINLKITNKVDNIDIFSPLFSIKSNNSEGTNWFQLRRFADKIKICSNFCSITELKRCTTYMINPIASTLLEVYEGFKDFTWKKHDWSEKMRFVFEVEMECDVPAVQATIWKHFTTEINPAINTKAALLYLDPGTDTNTVVNSSGVSCVVKRYGNEVHSIIIEPNTPTENWNLLTIMLKKLENNDWQWCYLHTTDLVLTGRHFPKFQPFIVFEINELITSIEDISDLELAAFTSVIKQHGIISSNTTDTSAAIISDNELQLNPAAKNRELQHLRNLSANLIENFFADKFCDISIHVQGEQIRAHKTALSTGSTVWHKLFNKNEQVDAIHITDFEYKTIKELIEYMYTGKVNQITDQLLIAADTFGVTALKELCEEALIETIQMENIINLLLLSDRYKASTLYDKVMKFIVDNCKSVSKLEETKAMCMMYPELSFKLFAGLSALFPTN